ncbi:hypothetical protein [Microbacterium sp. p3-SID336]|uniref:hypothetical protein n=1 Tax=Microbacterium sp. p3-SID336 TaxID=2916212 RepID=UPI0021A271BB|nr:hypothetical protein [Microbacterium sp. p3-SID336]MCT1478108.1 hypothetical protein [Microbacterium sp. p3-SID336]
MRIRTDTDPQPLVDEATIHLMELFFTSLIGLAGLAITFVAVVVLRGLFRGQR